MAKFVAHISGDPGIDMYYGDWLTIEVPGEQDDARVKKLVESTIKNIPSDEDNPDNTRVAVSNALIPVFGTNKVKVSLSEYVFLGP